MRKWIALGALFVAMMTALSFIAPTIATPVVVEWSEKISGVKTVEWTSSFKDSDYTLESAISITVEWDVTTGMAEFDNFDLKGKGFTPSSKKDPAFRSWVMIGQGDRWIEIGVTFDGLHWSEEELADIGNAHFKLWMMIAENGDGDVETLAGFGVNLHVEDPR